MILSMIQASIVVTRMSRADGGPYCKHDEDKVQPGPHPVQHL